MMALSEPALAETMRRKATPSRDSTSRTPASNAPLAKAPARISELSILWGNLVISGTRSRRVETRLEPTGRPLFRRIHRVRLARRGRLHSVAAKAGDLQCGIGSRRRRAE